jgi:hypothetical protein
MSDSLSVRVIVRVVAEGNNDWTSCVTTLQVICEEEYVVGIVEQVILLLRPPWANEFDELTKVDKDDWHIELLVHTAHQP